MGDDCAIYRQPGAREDLAFHHRPAAGRRAFSSRYASSGSAWPQSSGARFERYRRHGRRSEVLPALARRRETGGPPLDRPLLCRIAAPVAPQRHPTSGRRLGARSPNRLRHRSLRSRSARPCSAARWRPGRPFYLRFRPAGWIGPGPRTPCGPGLGPSPEAAAPAGVGRPSTWRDLGASAAMDLSDGISLDLHRMALAPRAWRRPIDPPPRFPRRHTSPGSRWRRRLRVAVYREPARQGARELRPHSPNTHRRNAPRTSRRRLPGG